MEAGEHLSCLPDQKRTGGHTLGANNSSTSTTMPKSRVWTSSPGPMAEASLSMGCPRPRGVFTSEILLIFGKRGSGSGGKTAVFTDHVLPRPRKLHPGLPVCRKTPQGRNSSSGGLQATLSAMLSILTWGALPIFPAIQTALETSGQPSIAGLQTVCRGPIPPRLCQEGGFISRGFPCASVDLLSDVMKMPLLTGL